MADSLPLDTRRYVPVEADDAPPTRIAAAKGRKSVLPIRPVLRGGNPVRHFRQDKAQTRFRSAPRHVERKPSMENSAPALARPKRWERYTLLVLFVGILLFGALVEIRSVFLTRRMGDFGCYARGAWAVRTGADLYDVTCDNQWHYNYPPFLAIALLPLADPPHGQDAAGMTPYALSVGIWYVFSVLCVVAAVHTLSRALEENSADPTLRGQPAGCRRWWALRLWPILICLAPIGFTLMRGQVNTLILALLCGLVAGLIRRTDFRAGLCLGAAVCIKVYPIFLIVYPLWHRNWRCLAGCLVGLFVGLVAIPAAVLGPRQTVAVYEKYATVLLGPALGGDQIPRNEELLNHNTNWSQSFKTVVHKTIYPDPMTRPLEIAAWLNGTHLVLGAALTFLVLVVGRRQVDRTAGTLSTMGSLILLMNIFCPVCHLHYFTHAVPLVMALMLYGWRGKNTLFPGSVTITILVVFFIANALPEFDELVVLRDVGTATYSGLLLIVAALFRTGRGTMRLTPVANALPNSALPANALPTRLAA